ncbi:MAG: twin-arginine translocation pathway signal protein [Phyllobacteriaceae bacterium]|nr:twin-arginine translocation pathway signal protein [Phyllobacteriaceae bacterium]
MTTIDRRGLVAGAALATLFATSARAEDMPMSPMEWTDAHGLIKDLPKDADPTKDDVKKFPRCRYCGMMRAKFSATRHLIQYEDDAVDATCSLHCAAIGLALNMDKGPKAIWAGDAGADGEVKPLVLVDKAFYVVDPSKPGTMTRVSNAAYADEAKAKAAAAVETSAKAGAEVIGFDAALRKAYLVMADDTIMLRKRRGEMRKKMKM